LVFEKNANCFAEHWEKSQKIVIITSTPGYPAQQIPGIPQLLPVLISVNFLPQVLRKASVMMQF
jgi:hypothetical protein